MIMSPTNLSECFDVLDEYFKHKTLEYEFFKNSQEEEAVIATHFTIGKKIRSNWGLWEGNSTIFKFLSSMQLWHADDMSSLILTSYHRYINDKPLELKQQIEHFLEYWKQYEQSKGPISKKQIKLWEI